MSSDTSLDGLEATVHQSILEPILVLRAPHKPAMLNILLLLAMLAQFRAWLWIPAGIATHLGLMWAASVDQFCIEMMQRSFQRKRYYGV